MEKRLTVEAGPHRRVACPVSCAIEGLGADVKLTDTSSGAEVPCQVDGGELHWVVDDIPALGAKEYVLVDGQPAAQGGVEVTSGDGLIEVTAGGGAFATYHHRAEQVRPYLNPVIGPTGDSVVRETFDEPSKPDHDHIHHKGILVAHGDVNGSDNWSEGKSHAWQKHLRTDEVASGLVFGRVAVANEWTTREGGHVMFEDRVMTFRDLGPDARAIDFAIAFTADAGDVVFGDTKEGGLVSVRVATPLRPDREGRMVSAVGGVGEKECWGKRAHWCDISGPLAGGEVGVAVFDGEMNVRHPTYWHIRNYGLFAANPFGLSYYYRDKARDGAYTLPKGERMVQTYRIFIHKGDAASAGVAEAYHNFANPPDVSCA